MTPILPSRLPLETGRDLIASHTATIELNYRGGAFLSTREDRSGWKRGHDSGASARQLRVSDGQSPPNTAALGTLADRFCWGGACISERENF